MAKNQLTDPEIQQALDTIRIQLESYVPLRSRGTKPLPTSTTSQQTILSAGGEDELIVNLVLN